MKQQLIHPNTKVFVQLYSAALSGILANKDLINEWTPSPFDPKIATESEHVLTKRVTLFCRTISFHSSIIVDELNDDYFFADEEASE